MAVSGQFGHGRKTIGIATGILLMTSVVLATNAGVVNAQTVHFLFKFGSQGTNDGQFLGARSGAVDSSDRIIVVDGNNFRIQVFDSNGNFLFKFGSKCVPLSNDPRCVDPDGSGPLELGDGQFQAAYSVAVDSSDRIIVSDLSDTFDRIQVFDSSGNFLFKFGSHGSGDGQFNGPSVAVDSSDRIIVSDCNNNRVQVFGTNGNFLFKFGSSGTGDGQFNCPGPAGVDGSNRIIVPDVGNHRIQVFDSSGNFLFKFSSFGIGDGQFRFPTGVDVDSLGSIIVSDGGNHRIQVFDSSGNFLFKFGSGCRLVDLDLPFPIPPTRSDCIDPDGSGPLELGDGQFAGPGDVALDSSDRIIVTDGGNFRIQVFGPEAPNSPPDCSAASPSEAVLWPPNHKMRSITINGVTDPDGDPVTITITGIKQDEPVDAVGSGDGNTSPDGSGVGTDTAQVRAERAGSGDGRVYHVSFTADDGNGGTCAGEVMVSVPHDKRGAAAVDQGTLFDSTVP